MQEPAFYAQPIFIVGKAKHSNPDLKARWIASSLRSSQ
jgi:hypothetical protein